MKKFIVFSMMVFLALPVMGGSTKTTTSRSYDSTTTAPLIGPVMDSERNSEMIEAEEESYGETLDQDAVEQERMEERMNEEQKMEESSSDSSVSDEDVIDYSDRTRTNRERKALNTGSNASDDN